MKSRNKKRLLALVLCMVVAISNSSFIFASETGQTEYPQEAEVQTQDEAVADDMDVAAYAADEGQAVADEQPAAEEQVAAEPTAEPETTAAAPAEQPAAEAPASEQPTAEAPAAEQPTTEAPAAETPAAQEPAAVSEGATTTSENTNASVGEAQTPQGEENGETVTYNQKMDLKQDFTDELGNVVATVSAEIPEGAFQVEESSQITMEVNTLTDTEKTQLENLMKEKIPAEKKLGQYVAYNIRFKVDGTETESLQPIKITMTGDKTQIDDVENATVFYLDPADPTVTGDKEELEEIVQRAALVKQLQEAGQSIENIDEDYDLSDIELNEDGTASKIQMEGRQSTIYGCYIENIPEQEDPGEDRVDDSTIQDPSEETPDPTTYAADTTNNSVTLTDDNGKLTASYTADNTEEYGYVWYRSINGGAFEAQEPTTYTSSAGKRLGSDIKADGTELYIALNGGALGYTENNVTNTSVQYKVAVFNKSDIENSGLPKNGTTAIAESRTYRVTSYYEVRNGGFETPNVRDKYKDYNHYQYSNADYASSGGVWQTTGIGTGDKAGCDIEIINTKDDSYKSPYKWYGSDGAAEEKQFAELNCEAAGALYQDILTTPGETLNYQLSHRARGSRADNTSEYDTMYVLIMSTALAKRYDVTTEARAQDIVNHPEKYSGATVVSYRDDDQKWTTHQGVYNVPENSEQYSTRFFFVAGSTASGDKTVGNFLDNIKLTRDRLTPVEGTATVTLTKTITGLTYTTANALAKKLTFTVGSHELVYSDLSWSWSGEADSVGTYTGTYVLSIQEREFGSLDVSEQATDSKLDVDGYTRNTSLFIDGTNSDQETQGSITVGNKDARSVEFKNNYVVNDGGTTDDPETNIYHEKYIKRNSDGTYDITLDVSGTVGTETKKANVDVVLIVDTSRSMGEEVTINKQEKTKLEVTQEAIEGLVNTFNSNNTVDVRYKLVTFAKKAKLKTENWVYGNDLVSYVNRLSADSGTNYDKGLSLGADAISTSRGTPTRPDPQKIVIFLTDGKPTYYGDGPSGGGNYTDTATYNNALSSAAKVSCDKFYAIGIGLPDQVNIYKYYYNWFDYKIDKTTTGRQILTDVANKTTASTKESSNLTNVADLGDKFQSIVGEVLTYECEKVVITDTLSQYVDPTDASKLVIKEAVKNADGTFTPTGTTHTVSLSQGGTVTFANGKNAEASYDANTKTATLTFASDHKLEKDHYYYLTITNVVPNEAAFQEYQTGNSYNAVGDTPSDASDDGYQAVSTGTSSGKKGFKSNASASISYTYKDVNHTESYNDPVIQVEKIMVEKRWVGMDDRDIKNQVVLVQLIDKKGDPVKGKVLKLSSQNNFQGSFIVEETDNYGGVRELKQDKNGSITYESKKYSMIQDNGSTTIDDNTYKVTYAKDSKDANKQIITNTKNSEKIKIIKTGTNTELKLEGAEFTLKDSEGNLVKLGSNTTGTYISDAEGLVLEEPLEHGTYTLTEVKAPDGYVVLPGEITINVLAEGDTRVTVSGPLENIASCEKKEDVYVITVKNEVVYDLPSTGHTGIFQIMMSGMLLIFAGVLIIFKLRDKGVLKK